MRKKLPLVTLAVLLYLLYYDQGREQFIPRQKGKKAKRHEVRRQEDTKAKRQEGIKARRQETHKARNEERTKARLNTKSKTITKTRSKENGHDEGLYVPSFRSWST